MKKTKPPVDAAALDGLLVRGRAAVAQLISDGEVDEAHLRRIFRMLEGVVLEAEETVEDLASLREADAEIALGHSVPYLSESVPVEKHAV